MADTMTIIEKTVFMKSVEVFGGIPTEALAQLAARATETYLDRGETLIKEGDEDQGVFVVVEGEIELRKGDVVVRLIRDGSTHGELFLHENGSHQYSAIAREGSHVLTLRRPDVLDALLEYPEFGLAMVQDLSRRHHQLTERVIALEKRLESAEGSSSAVRSEGIESSSPSEHLRRRWWQLSTGMKPPSSGGTGSGHLENR